MYVLRTTYVREEETENALVAIPEMCYEGSVVLVRMFDECLQLEPKCVSFVLAVERKWRRGQMWHKTGCLRKSYEVAQSLHGPEKSCIKSPRLSHLLNGSK